MSEPSSSTLVVFETSTDHPCLSKGICGVGNYQHEVSLKQNRYWVLGQLDKNLDEVDHSTEVKEKIVIPCNNVKGTKLQKIVHDKTKKLREEKPNESKKIKPVNSVQN